MEPSRLLDYYRSQACSYQWRGFLAALAEELSGALSAEDLAKVMGRLGERFARERALPRVETLEALESEANAVWSSIGWGRAAFEDAGDRMFIRHAASPLAVVPGAPAGWDTGFLEGVYRQWLRSAGMIALLDVNPVPGDDPDVRVCMVSRVF